MKRDWLRLCALAPAMALLAAGTVRAQGNATPAAPPPAVLWQGPDGKPLPFRRHEEVVEFLREAKMMKQRGIPRGITKPSLLELEKDGVRARAHFSDINEEKQMAHLASGRTEVHFRDSHKFNGAAYELARLLGLDNVPPATERLIQGRRGSVSLWIENAFTERERMARRLEPPDKIRWNRQVAVMRVFDNLIYNTDRTQENILIDKDWKLWMIDHTRAFRQWDELVAPHQVNQIERGMWEKLQRLDKEVAMKRLRPYLRGYEIEAIFKRRDLLVELIRERIAERGEDKVIFSWN